MIKKIDELLNGITMYRLILYYLIGLILWAVGLSYVGKLPFEGFSLLFSAAFLAAASYLSNTLFSRIFKVDVNVESYLISALILALIVTPTTSVSGLIFLFLVAALAMSSKYILSINKKHIFNPVALAVFLTSVFLNQPASWWVGTVWMLPAVLVGGILLIKKLGRSGMMYSFFIFAIGSSLISFLIHGFNPVVGLHQLIADTPLLFFGFVMFTEPLTTPPTKKLQLIYGALVGFLFLPELHVGQIYTTPELALILGNLYSFTVSPKQRRILRLKEKVMLAPDVYDFIFDSDEKLHFMSGQYLEYTLSHSRPDARGNRRYFTIASSPTEKEVTIGVRFYPNSSSFKRALLALDKKDKIVAGQLAGDFTLPENENHKLVFLAGGIGITPFRSMIKYLLDTKQKRDIVLIYSSRIKEEVFYKEIFDQAALELGIKVVYTITDQEALASWKGEVGRVDVKMLKKHVPDFNDRMFYISGPYQMVSSFKQTLSSMGVKTKNIVTDFFPGY